MQVVLTEWHSTRTNSIGPVRIDCLCYKNVTRERCLALLRSFPYTIQNHRWYRVRYTLGAGGRTSRPNTKGRFHIRVILCFFLSPKPIRNTLPAFISISAVRASGNISRQTPRFCILAPFGDVLKPQTAHKFPRRPERSIFAIESCNITRAQPVAYINPPIL